MRVRVWFSASLDIDVGTDDEDVFIEKIDRALSRLLLPGDDLACSNPHCENGLETWSAICRGCGCTDDKACEGGCSWAEEDLCSACGPVEAKTS